MAHGIARPGPARRLAVLAGAAALALCPAALAPSAAASPSSSPLTAVVGESGVGVALEQLGPTALTPGSQLVVRVRVTNTSSATVAGARARLFVNSPVLASRSALDAWAAGQGVQGGDRFSGVDGAEQPLGGSLSPGESIDVDFSVDADQLQLGSDFGPRGVTVDVIDSSLQRLTALRTFLVWTPDAGTAPTAPLTVVAPVTAGAPDVPTGQLPESRVEDQLDRLRDLLPAMSLPSTSVVVDPALLGPFAQPAQESPSASASGSTGSTPSSSPSASTGGAAGSDPSASGSATPSDAAGGGASSDPTSAGGTGDVPELRSGTSEETSPDVESWLSALRGRTTGSTVVLPQGDTDVVATAAAGTGELLGTAVARALTTVDGDDDRALLWPADPSATAPQALVAEAAAADRAAGASTPSAVLVDARTVPGALGEQGTGPSTASLVAKAADGSTTSATGVLVDAAGSSLLAAAGADGSQVDPAEAAARLLADTAASALAKGGVVLALPRGWDPDPTAVAQVLGPASSAPWVRATSLPDLLASPPAAELDTTSGTAVAEPASAPLAAGGLQSAAAAVATAKTTASLVADPEGQQALLAPVEASATAAAGVGWRDDPQGWGLALAELGETAVRLASGVQIVQGSTATVISSRVSLPVTVSNALSQPATVWVRLESRSTRLVPGQPVEITVPPGTTRAAQLPVRAAASGDTAVRVVLEDGAGKQIGEAESLRVRVRADWEGRGVAIAAGVVGLVFVGGVARTVVRVRRRPAPPVVRSAEEADADGPPTRRPEEPTDA